MTTRFEPSVVTAGGCNRGAGNAQRAKLLSELLRACGRAGIAPSRFVLTVTLADQTGFLYERAVPPSLCCLRTPSRSAKIFLSREGPEASDAMPFLPGLRRLRVHRAKLSGCGVAALRFGAAQYQFRKHFRCSTSRFGAGQIAGSNCTPLGLHRVAEKIGGGWPAGTVFKGRRPVGFTWRGLPDAKITTRILWLEGLEPGCNRGGAVDSHARYIYIHGTADQASIGRPASCGCIHLSDADLIPLFERLPGGTLVWIAES